jgi:hypothetical protein
MTKLFEHPTTQETKELPELPHGVVVPDDISGLEVPEPEKPKPPGHQVRWLRWTVAGVLVAVGAIVIGAIVRDDATTTVTQPSAYQLTQESIDQALLDNQTTTVAQPSAYQLIQNSIDQALLDNQTTTVTQPSAYQLIQNSIDQALLDNQ